MATAAKAKQRVSYPAPGKKPPQSVRQSYSVPPDTQDEPITLPTPQFAKDPAMVRALKYEILPLWAHHLENKFEIGKKLRALQKAIAKCGYGDFVQQVERDLEIPKSTAYRYIAYYKRVMREGILDQPIGLSQDGKDGWWWEGTEELGGLEAVALEKAKDDELKARQKRIEEEHAQAKRDATNKEKVAPDYLLRIHLPNAARRERFVDAWQAIGTTKQRQIANLIYKEVVRAANLRKEK